MQTPRPPLKVCVCVRERATAQHPNVRLPAWLSLLMLSIPFRVMRIYIHVYIFKRQTVRARAQIKGFQCAALSQLN
jgi:hypothetical protein